MVFGLGNNESGTPIEVKPRMSDDLRQNIIRCIDLSDLNTDEGEAEIQVSIDAMSTKGFKPLTTTLDTDNQLFYIIYERRGT